VTLEDQLRHAAPYIAASFDRSPHNGSVEGVLKTIASGNAHLLTGRDCALVLQPVVAQRIWHASGDFDEMTEILQGAWPRMQAAGFDELRIDRTRKGWAKRLRPFGFEQVISLVKED